VIYIGYDNRAKKQKWLTPTSINKYIYCPRKYYFKRIAKHPQKLNIHLIRGLAIHRAIELFYKLKINHCVQFDFFDFKRILQDLFWQEWRNQKKNLARLDLTETELEFYFHESLKMVKHFVHNFYTNLGFEKPSPVIEKNLVSEKLRLKGRVDAIFFKQPARGPPPLILDYKTSKSKEITEGHKRQLFIYALLYYENQNVIPDLAIHFLNFKDGLVKLPVSIKELNQTKELVKKIHNKIKSNNIKDYPCTCGWCKNEFNLIG